MMQDSFEVGTNQYLVKPVAYEEFEKKIRPLMNKLVKNNQRLTVELVSGGFQILPINSILTIQSKSLGRKGGVIIKTETQELAAYGKMTDYLDKLEKARFCRNDRSAGMEGESEHEAGVEAANDEWQWIMR